MLTEADVKRTAGKKSSKMTDEMDDSSVWRKYQPQRINYSNKKSNSSHDMTSKDKVI